jgi:hypothetical protein
MSTPVPSENSAGSPVDSHAARIRASGILGRSELLQRLFDFLIDCAHSGRVPKEIEIAIDGFGKDARFDASQDALVRVYVHKLRRKLEEFYAGPGRNAEERLVIPRGEYRLAIEPFEAATELPAVIPARQSWHPHLPALRRREWFGALAIALLLVAVGVLGVGQWLATRVDVELNAARHSSIWSPLLDDELPIYVVLGDYYIFGEHDAGRGVERLVRDFSINSRDDLEQRLQREPQLVRRYEDLNLTYLPTASAYALRSVLPILASANKRVRVVMASQLDASVLKSSHVIYIGYLSGLGGMLREIVFAGSRFDIGDSFDELVDATTGASYVSEAGEPPGDAVRYRDYGYFSTFAGPNGNRNLIIAGMRDTALMQTAETVTGGRRLAELLRRGDTASGAFEALYEVYGVNGTNIEARLLLTAPLHSGDIWRESQEGGSWRNAAAPAVATLPSGGTTARK